MTETTHLRDILVVLLAVVAVVPELVEGSLQLGSTLLRQIGRSQDEIEQLLHQFRRHAYSQLNELVETSVEER